MPRNRSLLSAAVLLGGAVIALALVVAGTGFNVEALAMPTASPVATPIPIIADGPDISPTPLPGNLDEVVFFEDGERYVIRPLLVRDAIYPIYEPQFDPADAVDLDPDGLVMGLEINGDARAYPINILRRREIVDDTVGGTPVLVSW